MTTRRILILGSTGSIGTQTLDVIEHLNALHAAGKHAFGYKVVGLAAGRNHALLTEQASRFGVCDIALAGSGEALNGTHDMRVRHGTDGAERLVREVDADIVVASMVGASGLPATLAAVQLGHDVALANKETLVAAGSLIVPAARASGSKLLPVDSEHAAVWQCLQNGQQPCPPMVVATDVSRIVLTASGGPFRTWSRERAYNATPKEALAHPTWTMGAKVTIDSASLTNKAFEVIEAHWLFGAPAERIGVLIHPQSIVHSLVEYADGNVIAQLGPPDMRAPIQYALTFPVRDDGRSHKMDFSKLSKLEFEEPDLERFPALALAYRVIREGGSSGAVFNAASEEAVNAFLDTGGPGLAFGRIPELAREAMDHFGVRAIASLADVLEADRLAREFVRERIAVVGNGARVVSIAPPTVPVGKV